MIVRLGLIGLFTLSHFLIGHSTNAQTIEFEGFSLPTISSPSGGVFDIQNGTIDVPLSFIRMGVPDTQNDFPNALVLAGLHFEISPNEPFIIANAAYFNGVSSADTNPESFSVTFDLTFQTLGGASFQFEFPFELIITTNNNVDPVLNADTLRPLDVQQSQSFEFEGEMYSLELLGFRDPAQGDEIVSEFTLLEDTATFVQFLGQIVVTPTLADVNMDGVVDFSDIPSFIAVLQSGEFQAEADVDQSGEVDFTDIPLFIAILSSQ